MRYSVKQIADYYDYKSESYHRKYNLGYYTHAHTGLYDPQNFPFLFRSDFKFPRLGLERIKHLLFVGQENLTNYASTKLIRENTQYILDCGCGHGGTSIYLAESYGVRVLGITLSKQQLLQCKSYIEKAELQEIIEIKEINIFDADFKESCFDGIIEIDSFCQIGEYQRLFPILSKVIKPGGRIVVCDNFINIETDDFKDRFDSYWWSDVSSLNRLIQAAADQNLNILTINDMTRQQIPFWKLSIAYSEVFLRKQDIQDSHVEKQRLEGSLDFHLELLNAFETSIMSYYCLVIEKPK